MKLLRGCCISRKTKVFVENLFAARSLSTSGSHKLNQKCESNKTVLFDFHKELGGKMVDFAGWCMPVVYNDLSISASHKHTRSSASIFDVSHMLQTKIHGADAAAFMESLVVGDVKTMKDGSGGLSLFTNEQGGIMDDVIINRTKEGYLYVVSNAGCSDKIKKHLQDRVADWKDKDVSIEVMDNGLIALQGPLAADALSAALPSHADLGKLSFMQNCVSSVHGVAGCRITRCGYTGEDGFEISIPRDQTVEVCEKLLSNDAVRMAGLAARDSLRLEAGLCLYGNDIDETTTPVQASLTWCIAKSRRASGGFPGWEAIVKEIKERPARRRVGLVVKGGIARQGAVVEDGSGKELGTVTSGCPSPSSGQNVAMAYISGEKWRRGSEVEVRVRKRLLKATVTRMPFVPANYYFAR